MLKSKRFVLTLIAGIIFIVGTFFFHVAPVELASGIGIILAPYLAAETYRSAEVKK